MRLLPKYDGYFLKSAVGFSTFLKLILNGLLLLICLALVLGIYKSGHDLFRSIHQPLETILQEMLLDSVFIVALLEIAITILGYLKDGRVHVRYIVDTILIIMLNEVVSLWFKHPSQQEAIGISVIIIALAVVRICVTRFAPKHED